MKKNHEKLIEKLREKFSLSPAEANRQLQLLREVSIFNLSNLLKNISSVFFYSIMLICCSKMAAS